VSSAQVRPAQEQKHTSLVRASVRSRDRRLQRPMMGHETIPSSIAVFTAAHVILGLLLKAILRGKPDVKGWPLFTYYHSMIHTALFLPCILLPTLLQRTPSFVAWLEHPRTDGMMSAEQWVQTANIGFTIAITLLSMSKIIAQPKLMVHHVVTGLGCAAWLHVAHGAGYGALFTCWTEFGSTMHNAMVLRNSTPLRWGRVASDVATRGGGMILLLSDAKLARARGLPIYLQLWTFVGSGLFFLINASWTWCVLKSVLRGNPKDSRA
jgi:hypothetical protein